MRIDWELKDLGQVFTFRQGIQRGVKLQSETKTDGQVRFLRIVDYTQGNELPRYIDNPGEQYLLDENDISLVRYGASTGFVCRGFEGALANNLFRLIPNSSFNINSEFLYYFLQSPFFQGHIQKMMNGAAMPAISFGMIKDIKFPIIEFSEQQQIVDILDQAFIAIDQAKANIEKNIENAKELFQSKLNDIFSQKGDGWEEKKIEEISTVVNGYSFKSKDFSADNEIKSIKITNVGIMEFVEDLSNNLPTAFLNEYSKVKVHEGDLVLALTRTIISGGLKVARVPESYNNSLLNQRVASIVPNINFVDSDFLYYYFSSNIVYNYVLEHVKTLMQPNLSISDLKSMPVPITSIEKQRDISLQIEDLSENIKCLIDQYSFKLDDLEELKKSILQKAFAGELTNKMVEV